MNLRALKNAEFSEDGRSGKRVALVLGEVPYLGLVTEDLQNLGFEVFTPFSPEFDGLKLGQPEHAGALESATEFFRKYSTLPVVQEATVKIVHPGVSFWAERSELVSIASSFDLVFVAPPPQVHRFFSNRVNLLEYSEKLKIPHLVCSFEPIQSVREFEKWRNHRPVFPVVLKSTRPTRGIGVIVLHHQREVQSILPLWLEQLQMDYRDSMVIIEKYKEGARKITLPFFTQFDGQDRKISFFQPIDRSLHSRTSAWVDVCPAPSLDEEVLEKLQSWTTVLINEIELTGFGQTEFLVDGPDAYLIDLSARLSDAYSLIQTVNKVSLIDLQLQSIFEGQRYSKGAPIPTRRRGNESDVCAIAFRVLAEDVMLQMPAPGRLDSRSEKSRYDFPNGYAKIHYADGEILSNGVSDGKESKKIEKVAKEIDPQSEGILAYGEVVVEGESEPGPILWEQAEQVFSDLWFCGTLRSSEGALLQLARHPWVKNGAFHSTFIDEEWVPEYEGIYSMTQIAALACIEMFEALNLQVKSKKIWVGSRSFSISLLRRLPALQWDGYLKIVKNRFVSGDLNLPGRSDKGSVRVALTQKWSKEIVPHESAGHEVAVREEKKNGEKIAGTDLGFTSASSSTVTGAPVAEFEGQIQIGAYYFVVRVSPDQQKQPVVRALTSGIVKSLFFLPGQRIEPQETLISLVSLHRLIQHRMPIPVRIKKWFVRPDQYVQMGDVLAIIDWIDDSEIEPVE